MTAPAPGAGSRKGWKAPAGTALLLVVASSLGGCAFGHGDFGRPRRLALETAITETSPIATQTERERDHRLRHFRRDPDSLPGFSPAARLNALRDAIQTDRALLPPLRSILAEADHKQHIRRVALEHFAGVDREARDIAGHAIERHQAIGMELCMLLEHRKRHYRASLETAVALGPEIEAVGAERSLLAFERDVANTCGPAAGSGMAAAGVIPVRPALTK